MTLYGIGSGAVALVDPFANTYVPSGYSDPDTAGGRADEVASAEELSAREADAKAEAEAVGATERELVCDACDREDAVDGC